MAFFRIQLALWMLSDRHEYARIPHRIGFRVEGESTFPTNQLGFAVLKDGLLRWIHEM